MEFYDWDQRASSTPLLVAPPNNATDQPWSVSLQWSSTGRMVLRWYDVYLGQNGLLNKIASV
jgi:hypothetical protein